MALRGEVGLEADVGVIQPTHGIFKDFFEQGSRCIEYEWWECQRKKRHSGYLLNSSGRSSNLNLLSHETFTIILQIKSDYSYFH